MNNKLILMVGAPGLGKTKYCVQNFLNVKKDEFPIFYYSSDALRGVFGKSENDQSVSKWVFDYIKTQIHNTFLFFNGVTIIVDATNISKQRRKEMLDVVNNFNNIDVTKIAYVALRDLETLKTNNKKRDRIVPEYVIERMYNTLNKELPTEDEGFDKIISI